VIRKVNQQKEREQTVEPVLPNKATEKGDGFDGALSDGLCNAWP